MAIKGNQGLTRNKFLPTMGKAVNPEFGKTTVPQGNVPTQQAQVQTSDPNTDLLRDLFERLNNFYVPRDGDSVFDCFGGVSNAPVAMLIPNVVGTTRVGFRYVVPQGQKLIIQSYLFFALFNLQPANWHGDFGGIDPAMWFSGFDNVLKIDGKSALFSNWQFYNGTTGAIIGSFDNLPILTSLPNDSPPNGLVNIIVPGGSTFEWRVRRAFNVPVLPRTEPDGICGRFRGYLTSKDSGKKNR
jgi:hypothetical protein